MDYKIATKLDYNRRRTFISHVNFCSHHSRSKLHHSQLKLSFLLSVISRYYVALHHALSSYISVCVCAQLPTEILHQLRKSSSGCNYRNQLCNKLQPHPPTASFSNPRSLLSFHLISHKPTNELLKVFMVKFSWFMLKGYPTYLNACSRGRALL